MSEPVKYRTSHGQSLLSLFEDRETSGYRKSLHGAVMVEDPRGQTALCIYNNSPDAHGRRAQATLAFKVWLVETKINLLGEALYSAADDEDDLYTHAMLIATDVARRDIVENKYLSLLMKSLGDPLGRWDAFGAAGIG